MSEIKSYIPYRGMIEVRGEGQGTYVSWYDYSDLKNRVAELEKWKAWAKDVMIDNEAERDGFRNGQVQVQAMLDEVMESNKNLARDLATLKEAVTDLVSMFAYRLDDPPRISTGGLSVLEDAFEILGYDDPHLVSERQCQFGGCTKTATSGTPTKNGYMRVCLKHFEKINLNPKEVVK
jgi:hypothetical protein